MRTRWERRLSPVALESEGVAPVDVDCPSIQLLRLSSGMVPLSTADMLNRI